MVGGSNSDYLVTCYRFLGKALSMVAIVMRHQSEPEEQFSKARGTPRESDLREKGEG